MQRPRTEGYATSDINYRILIKVWLYSDSNGNQQAGNFNNSYFFAHLRKVFPVTSRAAGAGNAKLQPVPNSLPGWRTLKTSAPLWPRARNLASPAKKAGKWQWACRGGPGLSSDSPVPVPCPLPNAGQKTQGQQWKGSLRNLSCVPKSHRVGLPLLLVRGTENLQVLLLAATHSHCSPSKAQAAFSNFYLQS